MWLSAGSEKLSSANGLLKFYRNMFVSYTSTQRAATLNLGLSVRTTEWVFLMILIEFKKIKLVSNMCDTPWCPRIQRSCVHYHNAYFE